MWLKASACFLSFAFCFGFILCFVNHCNFSLRWESFSKENSSVLVASLISHSEDPITVTIGCLQFQPTCAYFVDHNIVSTPQLWELECDLMWGCVTEWEDCEKKNNNNKKIPEYVTTKTELSIKCATNLRCFCQCSAMVLHGFSENFTLVMLPHQAMPTSTARNTLSQVWDYCMLWIVVLIHCTYKFSAPRET